MTVATIAGLAPGARWAPAFVAPELALPFIAFNLTLTLYGAFGVSSLLLLAVLPAERWRPVVKAHWRALLLLALAGNTFNYLPLLQAIQRSGPLLPTMDRRSPGRHHGSWRLRGGHFSPRRVAMPALLIPGGLMTQFGTSPASPMPVTSTSGPVLGLALAVAALASWAFHKLWKAELLDAHPRDPAHETPEAGLTHEEMFQLKGG